MSEVKRFYRSRDQKVLAGVCGGIAEYFGIDPVLVRILWVLAIFLAGTGVIAYIIAWIIVPQAPLDYRAPVQTAPGSPP